MGITPFFVENVSELQLCAIKLVTAVSLCFLEIQRSVSCQHLFGSLYPEDYIAVFFYTVKRLLLTFVCIHWCIILACVFTVPQNCEGRD